MVCFAPPTPTPLFRAELCCIDTAGLSDKSLPRKKKKKQFPVHFFFGGGGVVGASDIAGGGLLVDYIQYTLKEDILSTKRVKL